jgi:hypothetical protein
MSSGEMNVLQYLSLNQITETSWSRLNTYEKKVGLVQNTGCLLLLLFQARLKLYL